MEVEGHAALQIHLAREGLGVPAVVIPWIAWDNQLLAVEYRPCSLSDNLFVEVVGIEGAELENPWAVGQVQPESAAEIAED